MKSNFTSPYWRMCADYVYAALQRPTMYFQSLSEMEAMLSGHAEAFCQLGLIVREEAFNSKFNDWLYERKAISTSAGWAHAINQLGNTDAGNATSAFAALFIEFMQELAAGRLSN